VIGSVLDSSMRQLEAGRKENSKDRNQKVKNASLKLQLRNNFIAVILLVLLRERERETVI